MVDLYVLKSALPQKADIDPHSTECPLSGLRRTLLATETHPGLPTLGLSQMLALQPVTFFWRPSARRDSPQALRAAAQEFNCRQQYDGKQDQDARHGQDSG